MPVSGSGVILVEYTVPNGPSYLRPPALSSVATFLGSVWHPQPAATPKTYLPRATSSFDGAAGCATARSGPAKAARRPSTPSSILQESRGRLVEADGREDMSTPKPNSDTPVMVPAPIMTPSSSARAH